MNPSNRAPALRRARWSLRDVFRSLGGGPGYVGPPSDHFDGQVFFNSNPEARAGRGFKDFLKWQRTRQRSKWPEWVENRAQPSLPTQLERGQIALTFINHITFLLQFSGLNVLTDPVYALRASPFRSIGPRRARSPGLELSALPPIDLVLLSHNHYDHLDIETLLQLQDSHSPRVVTTLGNRAFLKEFGLRSVEELDWWQSVEGYRAKVTLTPAQHWSSRGPRNRNRTLWGGFIVEAGDRTVYFAGDTGYWRHFQDVRDRFGPVDLALLPKGLTSRAGSCATST